MFESKSVEQRIKTSTGDLYVLLKDFGRQHSLILLHGSGFTHEYFEPTYRIFEPYVNLVIPDIRGHGKSVAVRPKDAFTVDILTEDLALIVGTLGLKSLIISGTSLGAMIATEYALRQPQHPKALILDLPVFGPQAPDVVNILSGVASKLRLGDFAGAAIEASSQVPEPSRRSAAIFFQRAWSKSSYASLGEVLSRDRQFDDSEDRLKKMILPVLITGHRHDPVHRWEVVENLASIFPNAKILEKNNPCPVVSWANMVVEFIKDFV